MTKKTCTWCHIEKDLGEFYFRKTGEQNGKPQPWCKACFKEKARAWRQKHPGYASEWSHRAGRTRPMSEAKDSPAYLGIYVAERALSRYFDHIERMPNNNPGYDFLCGKGYKIDVKSTCDHQYKKTVRWGFYIRKNRIADYFLFIVFDNRMDLNPVHIWLVPGNVVNDRVSIMIFDTDKSLAKWSQYEKPLDKVDACCQKMRAVVA